MKLNVLLAIELLCYKLWTESWLRKRLSASWILYEGRGERPNWWKWNNVWDSNLKFWIIKRSTKFSNKKDYSIHWVYVASRRCRFRNTDKK